MEASVKFTVVASVHRGGTAGVVGEVDLHGFAVVGPDGSEVDWAFPGQEAHAEKVAARLNGLYAGREIVACKTCGATVTSKDPDRFPYCKTCFYVGNAHSDLRSDQIARLEAFLPDGWTASVEHTGGGCFWMAVRKQGEERYYILTDGEAGLPADADGERIADGGWGYVGSQRDDEDEAYAELFFSEEAMTDPSAGLSDAAAVALIVADIATTQEV